jgi:flagellar biosynthesis protein FlhG
LLVVSGGKGGVGTTIVAANLAVALARQGRRAVWVDADFDHGGNAPLLGLGERGSVADVLAGRRGVHEVLERGPSGVQVLAGAWASGEVSDPSPIAQERFIRELKLLAPHADAVVIDAGSSRTPLARRLWQAASAVAVVATPDSTAVMNAYAAIKTLADAEKEPTVYTLVNLAGDSATADEVHARIAAACRRFLSVRAVAAGSVPPCDFAARASGEHLLIFPTRSESARALDRAADTLWAHLQVHALRSSLARRACNPAQTMADDSSPSVPTAYSLKPTA